MTDQEVGLFSSISLFWLCWKRNSIRVLKLCWAKCALELINWGKKAELTIKVMTRKHILGSWESVSRSRGSGRIYIFPPQVHENIGKKYLIWNAMSQPSSRKQKGFYQTKRGHALNKVQRSNLRLTECPSCSGLHDKKVWRPLPLGGIAARFKSSSQL